MEIDGCTAEAAEGVWIFNRCLVLAGCYIAALLAIKALGWLA